jgi:hypothetical protein
MRDQFVAGLARELAHAVAFGAQHQGDRAFQIHLVQRLRRIVAGADDPDVALLQFVERARQVGHHEVRHGLGRAAGHLGHGGVDAGGMVLRGNHGMGAGAIGHAQAGAEVVRVGDAVEHQQQRRLATGLHLLEQVVERRHLRHRLHPRRHALVPVAATELGQAHAVGLDQAHTRFLDPLDELAHAGVAPGGFEIDLDDGFRRGFQPHADGVEAEKDFGATNPWPKPLRQ